MKRARKSPAGRAFAQAATFMHYLVPLLVCLLAPVLALVLFEEPGTLTQSSDAWSGARFAFALLAAAWLCWFCRPVLQKQRGEELSAMLVLLVVGIATNYATASNSITLFLGEEKTEIVELRSVAGLRTPHKDKRGRVRYEVCDFNATFRRANGEPIQFCTDLTRGAPLAAPGKAALHLRESWAGRRLLRLEPRS